MFFKDNSTSPDKFWREYEEKTGEKVLARCLGQYISGWEEFGNLTGIWGLIIFTSGGFRFHHFPQQSWIDALTRFANSDTPKERTIFVPKENIVNMRLFEESKWWKKLSKSVPVLIIQYRDRADSERQLLLNADSGMGNSNINEFMEKQWNQGTAD